MKAGCLRCGSEDLASGQVSASFSLGWTKFFTFRTSSIPIGAKICLDCGMIQLVGDVEKIRVLQGRKTKTPNKTRLDNPLPDPCRNDSRDSAP